MYNDSSTSISTRSNTPGIYGTNFFFLEFAVCIGVKTAKQTVVVKALFKCYMINWTLKQITVHALLCEILNSECYMLIHEDTIIVK